MLKSTCDLKTSSLVFSRSGLCNVFYNSLKNQEKKLVLACSGGPDSAAVIGVTKVLLDRKLIDSAHVVHVNHNLRKEAKDDLEVCRLQSQVFGLPFYSYDIYPSMMSGNIYKSARILRYKILQHHSCTYDMNAVITAHHADDVAETVLMHLTRGCGVDGLCGVRQRYHESGNADIVRPFFTIRKKRLEFICKKAKLPFCIDQSNFNIKKSRAYLRHEIIPALEKLNPCFVEHATKTAMIMQEFAEKKKLIDKD